MSQPAAYLAAICAVGSAAQAAPDPLAGGMDGWRFAICRMEAICNLGARSCANMPGLGDTYIWRDEDGLRIGGSVSMANPITAYDTPSAAMAALSGTDSGPVLVTPPEGRAPGWVRVALFDVEDGRLSDRFFRLSCETRAAAPIEPSRPVPAPVVPEVDPLEFFMPEPLQ